MNDALTQGRKKRRVPVRPRTCVSLASRSGIPARRTAIAKSRRVPSTSRQPVLYSLAGLPSSAQPLSRKPGGSMEQTRSKRYERELVALLAADVAGSMEEAREAQRLAE